MALGVLGAFGVLIWLMLPDSWTDPLKYAVIYGVKYGHVHINSEPKDCDFIHAPLGDKGCHYKKTVHGYNSRGDLVAGNDAPKFGTSEGGKPIVSYDDGKSWQWMPDGGNTPDTNVDKVDIDWVKIKE